MGNRWSHPWSAHAGANWTHHGNSPGGLWPNADLGANPNVHVIKSPWTGNAKDYLDGKCVRSTDGKVLIYENPQISFTANVQLAVNSPLNEDYKIGWIQAVTAYSMDIVWVEDSPPKHVG